ncbi:hypothetical protein KBD59_02140 [Candidatus Gracilibacteria bacterium]|nr:hypothetical protein [Candidatus Gracilibacteria bacterium]
MKFKESFERVVQVASLVAATALPACKTPVESASQQSAVETKIATNDVRYFEQQRDEFLEAMLIHDLREGGTWAAEMVVEDFSQVVKQNQNLRGLLQRIVENAFKKGDFSGVRKVITEKTAPLYIAATRGEIRSYESQGLFSYAENLYRDIGDEKSAEEAREKEIKKNEAERAARPVEKESHYSESAYRPRPDEIRRKAEADTFPNSRYKLFVEAGDNEGIALQSVLMWIKERKFETLDEKAQAAYFCHEHDARDIANDLFAELAGDYEEIGDYQYAQYFADRSGAIERQRELAEKAFEKEVANFNQDTEIWQMVRLLAVLGYQEEDAYHEVGDIAMKNGYFFKAADAYERAGDTNARTKAFETCIPQESEKGHPWAARRCAEELGDQDKFKVQTAAYARQEEAEGELCNAAKLYEEAGLDGNARDMFEPCVGRVVHNFHENDGWRYGVDTCDEVPYVDLVVLGRTHLLTPQEQYAMVGRSLEKNEESQLAADCFMKAGDRDAALRNKAKVIGALSDAFGEAMGKDGHRPSDDIWYLNKLALEFGEVVTIMKHAER